MSGPTKTTAAVGAAVLATVLFAGAASAQKVTLKMAHWVPPVHHLTVTYAKWAETIMKASGGTLDVKVDKSPLAKPPGAYDLAKNGVRDLAWGVAGYTPGRMPMIRGIEVPFATTNSESGSPALYTWYTRNGLGKNEFNDTKLITAFIHGPGVLHSKKSITTLEDLKGVKIRVGGGGVPIAKSLGGVPVAMSATKAHESLQRGTTTATLFPWEAIRGFRLIKLVNHHLEVPGGFYTTAFWVTMSSKTWNKLSGAHKTAIMKAGGAAGAKFIGRFWDHHDKSVKALVKKAGGHTVQTLGASELKRWSAKLGGMRNDWIKKADAKGHNGKALLAELLGMTDAPVK